MFTGVGISIWTLKSSKQHLDSPSERPRQRPENFHDGRYPYEKQKMSEVKVRPLGRREANLQKMS